jgi:hypothetical protein
LLMNFIDEGKGPVLLMGDTCRVGVLLRMGDLKG